MYHASAILLKGETVEQCVARKAAAREVAGRLAEKAQLPSLSQYWRDVQAGLSRDIARLKELRT